jgi:hypothetical protein
LLATLMAMLLMTVLATTLIVGTITEAAIAASYRDGLVARYAADAATERAIDSARAAPDWTLLATRATTWSFSGDGGLATVRASAATSDAGVETLELTAQAAGPSATVRTLVAVIARNSPPVSAQIRVISWRENP